MSTISRVGRVRGRMCIHKLPQPGQAESVRLYRRLMTRSTMGASVQIHEITVTLRMTPSSSDSTQRS